MANGVKRAVNLSSKSYRIQSLDRAMEIMKILGESFDPMGLAEVSATIGLHKATTHRFLIALLRHKLIVRTVHGRYLMADNVWLPQGK